MYLKNSKTLIFTPLGTLRIEFIINQMYFKDWMSKCTAL